MAPRQYLPRKIIIISCRLWGSKKERERKRGGREATAARASSANFVYEQIKRANWIRRQKNDLTLYIHEIFSYKKHMKIAHISFFFTWNIKASSALNSLWRCGCHKRRRHHQTHKTQKQPLTMTHADRDTKGDWRKAAARRILEFLFAFYDSFFTPSPAPRPTTLEGGTMSVSVSLGLIKDRASKGNPIAGRIILFGVVLFVSQQQFSQ